MSTSIRSMHLVSCVIALLFVMPVFPETPDQQRIKELEAENDALRQELAQLRLELNQLKREMKASSTKQDENSELEQEVEDTTEGKSPNDKSGKQRTFRSADEIYRSIPQELRPAKDGWDIADRQVVGNWLKSNINGKRFSARKEIASTRITYDSIQRLWKVMIYFEHEEMRFMSWEMNERITPITLIGDKDFIDDAKKRFKEGNSVTVTGTISLIRWDSFIIQKADENWHPTYCQLSLDTVQVK